MNPIYTYREATIQLKGNGIVCFRAQADDIFTEEDLRKLFEIMAKAADGNPFRILMQFNGFNVLLTKEARQLFDSDESWIKLIIAEAVVLNTTTARILFNLLLMVNKPKFPFKAFTTEKEAIKWLQSIK